MQADPLESERKPSVIRLPTPALGHFDTANPKTAHQIRQADPAISSGKSKCLLVLQVAGIPLLPKITHYVVDTPTLGQQRDKG